MSESKFVVDQEVIVSEAYATVNSAYVGKVGMVVYKFLSFEPFRYGLKFGNDDFLAIDEKYLQAVTDVPAAPASDDEDIPVLPHIPVFKPTDVEKQAAVDEIVAASTPAPEGGAGDDDRPYAVQAMSVIADLRRQLANSQSALETANNLIDQLHKDEQRLRRQLEAAQAAAAGVRRQFTKAQSSFEEVVKDCEFVGMTPNHLGDLRESLGLSKARPNLATPQPAPTADAVAELRAACEPFESVLIDIDEAGMSEDEILLKMPDEDRSVGVMGACLRVSDIRALVNAAALAGMRG